MDKVGLHIFQKYLYHLKSVSYTHLDVYKRQGLFKEWCFNSFVISSLIFSGPVSYTHLDVYKRQSLDLVMEPDAESPSVMKIMVSPLRSAF